MVEQDNLERSGEDPEHSMGLHNLGSNWIEPQRLAGIARRLMQCPTARISEVAGLDPVFGRGLGLGPGLESPRTFSDATAVLGRTLVICDTAADTRYAEFMEARCFPHVRFVLGVPLRDGAGQSFGALTLFDYKPRPAPDADEVRDIEQIAEIIAHGIEMNRKLPPSSHH